MTARSGYCPFCDASIPAPLLPLDYRNCKRCGAVVAEEDIVRKTNTTLLQGDVPRLFDMRVIGSAVMYDASQVTDAVVVGCNFNVNDHVIVFVSTCGSNQYPNSVSGGGTSFVMQISTGAQSHARTSAWYATPANGGESITVYWTGQHPHAAVITVMASSKLNDASPIFTTTGTQGNATSTSATPGDDASPTPANAYALFAVGAEQGKDSILTSPTGFSIAASNNTGQSQNPVDCEQVVFVRDLPGSDTVSSVVSLSGTTYYSEVMMIVNKS